MWEVYDEYVFGWGWLLVGLKRCYDIYDDVGFKLLEVDFGFIVDCIIYCGGEVNNGGGGCWV